MFTNADVYTTEGRRIGRVLVEQEFFTLGRSVRFARSRRFPRLDFTPAIETIATDLVTADVVRVGYGRLGLRSHDPVEHWIDVANFQKANVHAIQAS